MNIKEKIKRSGINQYEIAERINVSEFTFSRWMRRPEDLNDEKINNIKNAMLEIQEERKVI